MFLMVITLLVILGFEVLWVGCLVAVGCGFGCILVIANLRILFVVLRCCVVIC